MGYKVTSPLVIVRHGVAPDMGVSYLYEGALLPENPDPDQLKQLLEAGQVAEIDEDDGKPTTVKAILAAVGDDKELAQVALDEENAAEKPRPSLVEKLQAVIDA